MNFRQPHLFLAHRQRISQVRVEVGRMLVLVHNPKTLSLLGTLHFAGRSRNSLQAHEMWPPHTRYVFLCWLWTTRAGMRIASRLRVVVAPLVLGMEMEAQLSHQSVPARSRLYAVSRPGKSGALAFSLHSLPASLYKPSIRVLILKTCHTQDGKHRRRGDLSPRWDHTPTLWPRPQKYLLGET